MDDETLLRQFESCTLPFDQWTHRAHVRVAFLYLRDEPFERALNRIGAAIKAYNTAHNVPDGPTQGYNETTTHAMLKLIHTTMQAYGPVFPTATSEEFCNTHPQLMSKHILRCFYSPQRRLHLEAKTRFVAPDLAPLPDAKLIDPNERA